VRFLEIPEIQIIERVWIPDETIPENDVITPDDIE
jgi:hypothetical protein